MVVVSHLLNWSYIDGQYVSILELFVQSVKQKLELFFQSIKQKFELLAIVCQNVSVVSHPVTQSSSDSVIK